MQVLQRFSRRMTMPVKKAEFPVNKSENDRGTHQPQEEPYLPSSVGAENRPTCAHT